MLTIDQFHEYRTDLLGSEYHKLLPNNCLYCRRPVIINFERTEMKCSNKNCPGHLSHKADTMFKAMGFKDMGASTARGIIIKNNLSNHMDILGLTVDDLPHNHSREVKNRIYNELQRNRKQSIGNILSMYQLHGIGDTIASKLMEGFSSFDEFFTKNNTIEKVTTHVKDSLKRKNITMPLLRMSYHLQKSKEELLRAEKYFEVVTLSAEKIRVCMTGEISSIYATGKPFKPRDNLIKFLNEKYEGVVSFIDTGNNLTDAHFLCTDSTRKTGKYKSATNNNIPILSFVNFTNFIESTYGKGNEEYIIKQRF